MKTTLKHLARFILGWSILIAMSGIIFLFYKLGIIEVISFTSLSIGAYCIGLLIIDFIKFTKEGEADEE